MKIAVFSDTHLADPKSGIPFLAGLLQRHLPDAALVLHAGDLVHPDLLLAFAPLTVYAVRGNLDPAMDGVPIKRVIEVGGFRIGLIHGWGGGPQVEVNAAASFAEVSLDVLVYGHSHWPVCHRQGGVLVLNPGSCTDRRRASRHTFGVLEIKDGSVEARIVSIEESALCPPD